MVDRRVAAVPIACCRGYRAEDGQRRRRRVLLPAGKLLRQHWIPQGADRRPAPAFRQPAGDQAVRK